MQYYLITLELYVSVLIYDVCHLYSLAISLKSKQLGFLFQILMFTCYGIRTTAYVSVMGVKLKHLFNFKIFSRSKGVQELSGKIFNTF